MSDPHISQGNLGIVAVPRRPGAGEHHSVTMESRRPRALIADDHPPMLHAVGRLLSREVDVIAMVTDGQEAVSEALEHEPDLLVLDIAMPRLSGIAAAAQLKALGSHARIVFVTNLHDVEFVREALALGA